MENPVTTPQEQPAPARPTCVKMSYKSKKDAMTAKNWRLKARGRKREKTRRRKRPENLRIYFCEQCEAWHLSHKVDVASLCKNNWFKKRRKMDFIDDPAKVAIRHGWKPNDEL